MNTGLRVAAVVLPFACMGCPPPPCIPPPPQSVSYQCAPNPPSSWPDPCHTIQLDEENVLYAAKLTFSALPADIQTNYQSVWLKAIDDLNKADQILFDICTAGTPPTPAQLDAIAQATQAFLTAIEPIFAGSSAGQEQIVKIHDKAGKMLKDLGR